MVALRDLILSILVVALGASGTYLLLPHRHGLVKAKSVHIAGGVLAALAILLFATFWRSPAHAVAGFFFYAFSLAAVAGGLLMITSKDPIYSALWFATVVLSTSGLFLLAGAQFLAAGTVIVYAGAIIVTFLFVIMLAQMEGRAPYDRAARAPARATLSCYVLLWGLMYALLVVRATPPDVAGSAAGLDQKRLPRLDQVITASRLDAQHPATPIIALSTHETLRLRKPHVAGLGGSLYTDQLISAELSGTLLFVALIGALAIASPKAPVRPGGLRTPSATNV